ncbi:hypothetical protein A9Q86_09440 [Flavobacteriales bacterium 33_180_T64]|nr:hypothetical protein A9Q86_09440 [Flavobacteriales bacterium 33_180_T64]
MKLKIKDLSIDKRERVSFLLTLIATLVGVLIALWLTNSGMRNKEKEDSIKLLETANLILTNTHKYTKILNNTVVEQEKDTINNGIDDMEKLKTLNPIPYPELLETIISNELISKNISEYTHSSIYNGLINLKKLAKYETAEYYQNYLEQMILLLSLEIERLEGEINSEELESKFKNGKNKIESKVFK